MATGPCPADRSWAQRSNSEKVSVIKGVPLFGRVTSSGFGAASEVAVLSLRDEMIQVLRIRGIAVTPSGTGGNPAKAQTISAQASR